MQAQAHDRVLTDLDYVRLARLLERDASVRAARPSRIDDLLDDARIVSPQAVEPSVATMYSQVLLRGVDDGVERRLTLCYPKDAEPALGLISVLSPLGLGLLGKSAGSLIRWQGPDGLEHTAELEAILFQPEASGDFVT